MNLLETINANDFVPEDYAVRNVVRCVILSDDGNKVLLFGHYLPGGGVEDGETDADAIARECMEEVGAKVEVIKALGQIVTYRDFLRKQYVVNGYLCKLTGEHGQPTTTHADEQKIPVQWVSVATAVSELEEKIEALSKQFSPDQESDVAQRKIYNRKISLRFLKEAIQDK